MTTIRLPTAPCFPNAFREWRHALHAKRVREWALFLHLRCGGGERESISVALAGALWYDDVIHRVSERN